VPVPLAPQYLIYSNSLSIGMLGKARRIMPRQPRRISSTGIYHVMFRGVNRQRIFEEETDYCRLLAILSEVKAISECKLYAYCLMDNHVHLLIQEVTLPLSLTIKRLCERYATWFNQKYERCGHLYQGRYISEPVETDAYFITALMYIYQNPTKAGICMHPQDYPWSSRRLLGQDPLVDEDELFKLIPKESILEKESDMLDEGTAGSLVGRRTMLFDGKVHTLMLELADVTTTSEFQVLDARTQGVVFFELYKQGASIRQLARLSGVGRKIVTRAVSYEIKAQGDQGDRHRGPGWDHGACPPGPSRVA